MAKLTATTSSQLRVCVLGDLRHREFTGAAAWLKSHAIAGSRKDLTNCQLVVLVLARRGQFNSHDVEQLRRAAPLARIVALTGSWCDGPWRRAGDLLPGVTIVPWHRFVAWAEVNRQQLAHRRAAAWSLPETSTSDELADFWSVQPLSKNCGLILIDCDNAESAEALADVVRAGGFSAVWQSPPGESFVDGVRASVCEANDARPATLERVAQMSRQFAPSPVIVVINFPRAEDIEQILAAGAAAVVAKPFTLHEILAQLEDALRREGKSRSTAA